jgi:tRNA threonylcarbamoyladenosine biosynthesis protein TsaB
MNSGLRRTNVDDRFLIIDTAHRRGQVALASGPRVLSIRLLDESRRHARDLAPAVQDLLHEQGWRPASITGVIVSRGPGSYTGLRVGLVSAKTLAYATGCLLLGVETFAAIARQVPCEAGSVDVIADAQQEKIYAQRFDAGQAGPLQILPLSTWLDSLSQGRCVTGPGLELYGAKIPSHASLAPRQDWLPRPESLLAIARERLGRGERDDPFTLEPLYLRASSAEEKWGRP